MSRYIDAELIDPYDFYNCTPYEAMEIIGSIPTADVVEVVRCKDCKHYKGEQFNCWLMRIKMQPADYCSYGERSEE